MSNNVFLGTIASQRPAETGGGVRNVTSVQDPTDRFVEQGTIFEEISFPNSLIATLDDATSISLGVTWAGSYDENTPGAYDFVGTLVLLPNITNTTNITASITVNVTVPAAFDVFVSPDGDDSNSGLSFDDPLETLGAALALAISMGGQRAVSADAGVYTNCRSRSWERQSNIRTSVDQWRRWQWSIVWVWYIPN